MSKKRIIMIAAVGLVSFAGAFVFAWLTKSAPASQSGDSNEPTLGISKSDSGLELPQPEAGTEVMKTAMTEKQLKNLVYEVREKIQEYNDKLRNLELREQRLQMAQDTLKEDIKDLNNLQLELASIVTGLKSERDKLLQSRVEIAKAEKANLESIAATYDKMDASSAGKILSSMCSNQIQSGTGSVGSSFDDAVKILHYMTERTKAKVLAELVTSEPKLAALICHRLKQIAEGK